MALQFSETLLPGVVVIEPRVFEDHRGFFLETYHRERYADAGIDRVFVQDNHSHSHRGILRGLHYQVRNAQGKLVYVVSGEIFDVAVDIRRGSPTFGKWVGVLLSGENRKQIYVPEGYAHGFCVLSQTADVIYKCTAFYSPNDERGLFWADPDIRIEWPVHEPLLSEKDKLNPMLKDVVANNLPIY